jgi:hypothetical protein
MNNFNKWAESVRASSRYVAPQDTPQGYYFDAKVFKQNLQQKTKSSVIGMLKRLLGIAIIVGAMSSCNNYFTPYKAANTGGKHCSKRSYIR